MDNYRVLRRQIFHFDTRNKASGEINTPVFSFRKDLFQVSDQSIQLRFSLLQATVPYTWYNISDNGGYSNNWMDFYEDGNQPLRLTISAGNYNITQILTALNNQINSISSKVFSYSFDSITLKASWTYTGNGTVSFGFSNNSSDSLSRVLGFETGIHAFSNKTLTSQEPVNVSQSSDVFVNITNLQGISYEYVNGTLNNSTLFCVLPIVVPFFNNITYVSRKDHEYQFIISSQSMPDSLSFSMTNQYDELIPLNRNWNITLVCEWITQEPKMNIEYNLLEKLLLVTYKIAQDTDQIKTIPRVI